MSTHHSNTPATYVKVNLSLPPLAMPVFLKVAAITGATCLSIGGGFLRGLYMRQFMNINAQINDVDIFADIAVEDFSTAQEQLQAVFGQPVRFHVGRFETEQNQRGLIEFAIPQHLKANCAFAETIQINFGKSHPWADAPHYCDMANVGINRISMQPDGSVIAAPAFMDDMQRKTMTMNNARIWSLHDWTRTVKSIEKMRVERPEFNGWGMVFAPKPEVPDSGAFWQEYTTSNYADCTVK
jgi:hypothetical protein